MKSRLFGTATIAALALGCSPPGRRQRQIGFVSTFSGSQAAIARTCAALSISRSASRRQDGRQKIEIVYEDDPFSPTSARRAPRSWCSRTSVNFVAGYIWSNVSARLAQDGDRRGRHHPDLGQCRPSQIAGELCNKNYFSTSWQNDQTPMAMGEYLNKKGVARASTSRPQLRRRQDMLAASSAPTRASSRARTTPSGPTSSTFFRRVTRSARPSRTASSSSIPARHGVHSSAVGAIVPNKTVPLLPGVLDRRDHPAQQGELALGTLGAQEWSTTCRTSRKRYVADFKKKHNPYPSYYGAQSYDAIMLMPRRPSALKGLSRARQGAAELKKAKLQVARAATSTPTPTIPIQNFYIQEDGEGPAGHDDGEDDRHRRHRRKDSYYEKCR